MLSGDTGQHASLPRGDALRILEQHSRLQSGLLTRIRRQRRAEYRRAVELAAQKHTVEAFAQLESMGAVTELACAELPTAAAPAYLKVLKAKESALLAAPTWAEIEVVTERVRGALKQQGLVGTQEHPFRVFDSLSWTEAQKGDARQYRPGMVLRFHQAKGGFARHESVEVVNVAGDTLQLRRRDGSPASLKMRAGPAGFDVGEVRTLQVAPGDKLLLQANWQKRLINGELVEVKAIQGETILLADGRTIPEDYRAFTHGYAVTSHAAQGKTVNEVLVVASSRSSPAIHQEQFYVSISRGRERCQVFTDDAEILRGHVTRSSTRTAALEALPSEPLGRRKLIRRILQWAGRVGELMRLNVRLLDQRQVQPLEPLVPLPALTRKPYENTIPPISFG